VRFGTATLTNVWTFETEYERKWLCLHAHEWHNSVIAGAEDAAPAIDLQRERNVSALLFRESDGRIQITFHPHEQLVYVVTGCIQFDVNSETIELRSKVEIIA
jgi:quercetin dioxygenase-like cupin family protein